MITKEKIAEIAGKHLEGSGLYVTSLKIGADNHIGITIDGDEGVNIDDCVALSRAIESSLDRDREDFSLDVSSHGATTPLVLPRQFPRHTGRDFELKLQNGEKAEGKMIRCDENGLTLESSTRENKPVGKGKITVTRQQTYAFSEIREARIKLKY